jgi:hypothetical protein
MTAPGSMMSMPCKAFLKGLEDIFNLDRSVAPFLQAMADINDRPAEYFICMALEEFKMYLDQEPEFEVDLDEDDEELKKILERQKH